MTVTFLHPIHICAYLHTVRDRVRGIGLMEKIRSVVEITPNDRLSDCYN